MSLRALGRGLLKLSDGLAVVSVVGTLGSVAVSVFLFFSCDTSFGTASATVHCVSTRVGVELSVELSVESSNNWNGNKYDTDGITNCTIQ